MLIRREVLAAVLPAVTDDDTRYFLSKVQIRPDGEVRATNGNIAILASGVDGYRFPDEDFPTIPGAPFHGDPSGSILVDEPTIKRLIGATDKGKRSLPVLRCVQVSRNGSELTSTLSATDLKAPITATIVSEPTENFPELDRVMPAADKADTVALVLGVPVLEALLKAAKAIDTRTIRFDVPTDGKDRAVLTAIRVTATGPDAKIVAVAMPCRF